MITMIGVLFLCWISTRNALSQNVAWSVATSVPRFKEQLNLTCSVDANCCSSSFRIWENDSGTQLLNDGVSSNPDKYEEDWDGGTSGFNLIIKKLDEDDRIDYNCRYSFGNDKHTLTQDATWEYLPTEKCEMMVNSDSTLTGTVHIAKCAPYPTVTASYGGRNVTSDLTITGPEKYDTWFYRLTISINVKINCQKDDRFTLSVITGTHKEDICNAEDLCRCVDCFAMCYGISFSIQLLGVLVLLIVLFLRPPVNPQGCSLIFASVILRMAIVQGYSICLFNFLPTTTIGLLNCPCKENYIWILNVLWSCLTGMIGTLVACVAMINWAHFHEQGKCWQFLMVIFAFFSGGISILIFAVNSESLLLENRRRTLKQLLHAAGLVVLFMLILPIPFLFCYLSGGDTRFHKKWLPRIGILILIFLVFPIPMLIIYFCCLNDETDIKEGEVDTVGGSNRSKESGSSCWPPCSVGPDPNSPDPENARSLLKKNADKKNEKKPVAVVRSQPPKNRHVKTDNTESTRYSAETEIFDEGVHKSAKSRPLPSIGQPTISPRPLPQMPPSSQLEKGGIQLEPLGDSTSEKKKKKRRKKKESKQSGDED